MDDIIHRQSAYAHAVAADPQAGIRAERERARELLRELTGILEGLGAAGYEASVNGYQVTIEREPVQTAPSGLEERERTAAQWYSLIREQ
ncbi:MAG TPA: hypothetical protein VGN52_22865 [Burkholderiales bacterium]